MSNDSDQTLSTTKKFAIGWKSSASGRIGVGTTLFEKEEAERLVAELNQKYPDIDHEAVLPEPAGPEPVSGSKPLE